MGIIEKIKSFFIKESEGAALQSASKRFNSDLKRSNQRFKSLQSASNFAHESKEYDKNYENQGFSAPTQLSQPIELEKESLQLGVAAGYTGKSIREIESSLARIESQMTSKDWFISNFEDNSPEIIEILNHIKNTLERHDSSALNRFEALESALNRLSSTARTAPESVKRELVEQIDAIRSNLPLTSKMKELVETVREHKEISYDELCQKLGVTRSSLRGLLSNTMKRTGEIERHSIGGKGHVAYKHPNTTQI